MRTFLVGALSGGAGILVLLVLQFLADKFGIRLPNPLSGGAQTTGGDSLANAKAATDESVGSLRREIESAVGASEATGRQIEVVGDEIAGVRQSVSNAADSVRSASKEATGLRESLEDTRTAIDAARDLLKQ